jgi:transcriptional regulator with XRE-family HTH domain
MLNELAMSYAGKNLKHLRKLRGWTQEEFARKLKIKRSLGRSIRGRTRRTKTGCSGKYKQHF